MSDARKRGMEYAMTIRPITASMFTKDQLAVAWCAGEERGRNDALDAVMEIIEKQDAMIKEKRKLTAGLSLASIVIITLQAEIQQLKKGGE